MNYINIEYSELSKEYKKFIEDVSKVLHEHNIPFEVRCRKTNIYGHVFEDVCFLVKNKTSNIWEYKSFKIWKSNLNDKIYLDYLEDFTKDILEYCEHAIYVVVNDEAQLVNIFETEQEAKEFIFDCTQATSTYSPSSIADIKENEWYEDNQIAISYFKYVLNKYNKELLS